MLPPYLGKIPNRSKTHGAIRGTRPNGTRGVVGPPLCRYFCLRPCRLSLLSNKKTAPFSARKNCNSILCTVRASASRGGEVALNDTLCFDITCSNHLTVSPLFRGSNPYPCGSLAYRVDPCLPRQRPQHGLYSYYKDSAAVCQRVLDGHHQKKKQKARGTRERRGRLPKSDDKASAAEKRGCVRRQGAREGELPAGQEKPTRAAHVQSGRFRGFFSFKNGGQRGENTFSARLRAGPATCTGPARRRRGSKGIFFREGGEGVGEVCGAVLDVVEVLVGVEAVVLHLDQGHGDVGTVVRDALTVVQEV